MAHGGSEKCVNLISSSPHLPTPPPSAWFHILYQDRIDVLFFIISFYNNSLYPSLYFYFAAFKILLMGSGFCGFDFALLIIIIQYS